LILLNKGIVQYYINDLLSADLTLKKSYSIYKDTKVFQKKYGILNQLGLVSNGLKDHNAAINYLLESLKIVEDNELQSNENEKEVCLSNLGLVYQDQKDFKKAIFYYEKTLKNKNIRKQAPQLYSNIIDNLAYSKLKSNNYKNLPDLFYESLKIRDSIDDSSFIVLSNTHLSEYYNKTGDFNTSIEFANKALLIAKNNNISIDIVTALKQAAAVDKIKASSYTNEYIRINDSLLTAERKNLDRFARIQLETDEVIKENKALGTEKQNLLYYFLGTMLLFSIGFLVYNQKQRQKIFVLKQEQQATNQQIFDLMINQQEAVAQGRIVEKKRIAKELHDGILSKMFGTRLYLDTQNRLSTDEAIDNRYNALEELKNIEQQIREISHEMNSEKGKIINNFVGIVVNLLEDQKKKYSCTINFEIDKDIAWEKLDNFAKINLYRILQETLQNANKYSNASQIDIMFDEKDTFISLKITDNGDGFDVKKAKKGIGIANMIERAEESGGNYNIESTKKIGTTTTVTLPTNKLKTKPTIT
jgi:signal transduction histidine kinase